MVLRFTVHGIVEDVQISAHMHHGDDVNVCAHVQVGFAVVRLSGSESATCNAEVGGCGI